MSRKNTHQKDRKLNAKNIMLKYGVIPITGALILPFIVGGGALAVGNEPIVAYALARADAQSFIASSTIIQPALARGTYSATTPAEIVAVKAAEAKRKQEEEAVRAKALAAQAASVSSFSARLDYSMVAAGSGEIRWPLPDGSWQLGAQLGDGRNHEGVDMIAAEGTPIYAAAAGTVKLAQNGYYGYGTAVVLVHNVGGQQVETLYAHMPIDSFVVRAGETVAAGQHIGYVGNTGRSFGAHLHLEVRLSGSIIDGYDWLRANAG